MNYETRSAIVETIYDSTRNNGFLETMNAVFGKNFFVSISLDSNVCASPIEILELGNRAINGLHRTGINTIGDLSDFIKTCGIDKARNIGKKTISQIKSRLLLYAYERLSIPERKKFIEETVINNFDTDNSSNYNRVEYVS